MVMKQAAFPFACTTKPKQILGMKTLLTTLALILNRSDGTLLPPIHGSRQLLALTKSIAITLLGRRREQPLLGPAGFGAQIHGLILLIGEIGKLVQPQLVGLVPSPVMLMDEPHVVLEYLEPALFLPQGIVGLAMLHEPCLVEVHEVGLGHGLEFGVVVNDGHVESGHDSQKGEREEEDMGETHCCVLFVLCCLVLVCLGGNEEGVVKGGGYIRGAEKGRRERRGRT